MKSPKISVIIPVYNVEPYLRKCLDSVINQTYRNLEIIIVDDGSPDTCGAICDEYAAKDSRIWVIHQKNAGVSAARNAGLNLATGEWLGFVDSDDYIEPDMYDYLLDLAQRYDADIAQCGTFYEYTDDCRALCDAPKEQLIGTDRFTTEIWALFFNSACNKLYRTQVLDGVDFDPTYPIGEDLLFNLHCVTKNCLEVAFGTQIKYHYIQNNSSACHKPPTEQTLLSHRRVLALAVEMFETNPVAYTYFREEFFRNELDVCSKIVRFYRPEFENAKEEIRHNLRACAAEIKAIHGFSRAERIKFWLISYVWPLYRILLLASKKLPKRR